MASCENKYITLLDLSRQAKVITGETACFDGKIQVGLPFSGYPTGVDTGTTVSLGIVSSETAVFSGNTGTTIFDVSNTSSPNYDALFSGYSGTVWTNDLFSGNTSGLTLPITPLSADTQIVGPFWTLTKTGMTGDYVIGTEYTGYSITYSVSQLQEISFITGFTAYSGFSSASQENFSAGTLDYKGPLDYISSVEDATIDGRLTTNKLTVTGGASASTIGYVLTQLDETGKAGWVFNSASASTNTFVTGGTLNGTNLDLTWNTGGSVPSIDFSSLSGGTNFANTDLTLTGDRVHDLSGYTATFKDDTNDQTQLRVENLSSGAGASSSVNLRSRGAGAVTTAGSLLYGGDNFTGITSFNDGGSGLLTNALTIFTGGGSPGIRGHINIGSRRGSDAEVRIFNGGSSFDFSSLGAKFTTTGFTSYQDVYVPNLNIGTIGTGTSVNNLGIDVNGNVVSGSTYTGNTSGDCITDIHVSNIHSCSPLNINPLDEGNVYFGTNSGVTIDLLNGGEMLVKGDSILHSDSITSNPLVGIVKGQYTEFNWDGLTSNIISNSATSGSSTYFVGDFSTTGDKHGSISYFGSGYTRTGITTVPSKFYQNKVLIRAGAGTDGMVVKGKTGDPNGTLWFEFNGSSVAQLYSDSGYFGLGLNPDGSEKPTTHLQVGGTGTTGTFKFLDGNEQNGYVLTSDANGVGSWVASTSGFVHYLGEEFGGGIIYHLYKDNLNVEHGLIVSTGETTATWQNLTGTVTGGVSSWNGSGNTSSMTISNAATYVNGLTDGGFTDWYLPSIDELKLLLINRFNVNKSLDALSATELSLSFEYWSSTERDASNAYVVRFFAGNISDEIKTNTNSVRAVRAF
tara:strand:- start:54 stop:2612 length:2559 start_codon:yes stop_codon:yes gene_type:complete